MPQKQILTHSEPDAEFEITGGIHVEDGHVMVGDTRVGDKLAAQLGLNRGGSRMVWYHVEVYALTAHTVESDPTLGGAFAEKSEPEPPPV